MELFRKELAKVMENRYKRCPSFLARSSSPTTLVWISSSMATCNSFSVLLVPNDYKWSGPPVSISKKRLERQSRPHDVLQPRIVRCPSSRSISSTSSSTASVASEPSVIIKLPGNSARARYAGSAKRPPIPVDIASMYKQPA